MQKIEFIETFLELALELAMDAEDLKLARNISKALDRSKELQSIGLANSSKKSGAVAFEINPLEVC